MEGGRYPCAPLDMHPPRPPPLEPEAGTRTNLLNLHIYSDFLLFLSIESTMSQLKFVHFMIISQIRSVPYAG